MEGTMDAAADVTMAEAVSTAAGSSVLPSPPVKKAANLWSQHCLSVTTPAPTSRTALEDDFVWIHQAIEMTDAHTVLLVGVNPLGQSTCVRVEDVYQKWMFVAKETAPLTEAQRVAFLKEISMFMVRLGIINWRKPTKITRRPYLYPMMRHATLATNIPEAIEEDMSSNHEELRSLYIDPVTNAYRTVNLAEITVCCNTPYTYGSKALRELLSHIHRIPSSSSSAASSSSLPNQMSQGHGNLPNLGATVADMLPCYDSLLEQLLITKKFQGGAWIRVLRASRPQVPMRTGSSSGSTHGPANALLTSTCAHEYRVKPDNVTHVSIEECQRIGLSLHPSLSILSLRTWIKHTYREVDPSLAAADSGASRKTNRAMGGGSSFLSDHAVTSDNPQQSRSGGQAPVVRYDSDIQIAFLSYSFRASGDVADARQETTFLTWLTRKPDESESDRTEQVERLLQTGRDLSRLPDAHESPVHVFDSENQMLTHFVRAVQRLDPDVVVGLRVTSILRQLNERIAMLNSATGSMLGRIRTSVGANGGGGSGGASSSATHVIRGRLLCDLTDHISDHVRSEEPNVDLATLARLHQINVYEYQPPSLQCLSMSTDCAAALEQVIEGTLLEHEILHCVMERFPILKLASTIATTCGCLLSHTLQSGKVTRTVYLLLHLYHQHGYIMPTLAATQNGNRLFQLAKAFRQKGASGGIVTGLDTSSGSAVAAAAAVGTVIAPVNGKFRGGLNLEPKVGFYRKAFHAVVDIVNDYPSQIQQHNLCLSNQKQWCDVLNVRMEGASDEVTAEAICSKMEVIPLTEPLVQEGLDEAAQKQAQLKAQTERDEHVQRKVKEMAPLPRMMHTIQTRRRQRKREAAEARTAGNLVHMEECETEQLALKLVLNSIYGNFGHDGFRFEQPLFAEVVTLLGRVALTRVVEVCTRRGFEASSGDTDALMFDTREHSYPKALECAHALVREYNQPYPFVQLELGSILRAFVNIKCKNYMALEVVGPDKVKFDVKSMLWNKSTSCEFARWVCEFICHHWMLRSVMSIKHTPVAEYGADLQCLRDLVTLGQSMIEARRWDQFTLHQTLNQDLYKYVNDAGDHVKVAKWMLAKGLDVQEGVTIPYIICIDMTRRSSTNSHARDGVYPYHPMEVEAAQGHLQPSLHWYIQNKICNELREIFKIMSLKKPVLREHVADSVKAQGNNKLLNQVMAEVVTRAYHAQQHIRHPVGPPPSTAVSL